ncbi:MAG: hypothetical protein WC979_05345 [Candidatus Pacearchaeota archaeon]|jgi:hypothetical protein
MSHKTLSGKELVEWNEIFEVREGYLNLNSEFLKLLNLYFFDRSKLEELKKLSKDLIELKNNYQVLDKEKSEKINQELSLFEAKIQEFNSELKDTLIKAKKEIKDFSESCKQELSKKFLLELESKITDKNKAIMKVLKEFYSKIIKINDYQVMDKFKIKFQEIIPSLDIDKQTKNSLLEICSNKDNWQRLDSNYENQREWDNIRLSEALRIMINYIASGYEAIDILLTPSDGVKEKKFRFEIKSDSPKEIKVKSKDKKQEVELNESDDYEEEVEDITDNL